ncbi:speckle-type POZ protein-like [Planococcus citri]|uniref:speckle-type POZ protein-like n=1 Tax=Planococcus citri TaxID=170843 RepID=UPI0031F77735
MASSDMQNFNTSSSSVCRTEVNFRDLDFVWMIDNYRNVIDKRGSTIKSSAFSASGDEFKWCLHLAPMYDPSRGGASWVSLFLYPNDTSDISKYTPVSGNVKLSLINAVNEEKKTQQIEFTLPSSNGHHYAGFYQFVERNYLFDEVNQMLPKDQLKITCQLSYIKMTDIVNVSGLSLSRKTRSEENKTASLGGIEKLFLNDKFSDVTLCVNKQKYPAHKSVLAARCPYFWKMFEADLTENNSDSIELKEIDEVVFREVLHFIYTGNAQELETMVPELLEAADKFGIDELKRICEEELFGALSTETAGDILILADRFNAENLKMLTMDYVKVNSYNPNMLSEEVRNKLVKSHPDLLLKMLDALAKVSSKDV